MPPSHLSPPKTLLLTHDEWAFKVLSESFTAKYERIPPQPLAPEGADVLVSAFTDAIVRIAPRRRDLLFLLSGNRLEGFFFELDKVVFRITAIRREGDVDVAVCRSQGPPG